MKTAKYLQIAIVALLLIGCSDDGVENGTGQDLMPVLFSAGNMEVSVTRSSASYMAQNSCFVCSMFFHAGANDTDSTAFFSDESELTEDVNMMSARLMIDNQYGNAAYQDKQFYWQNRLDHVFLALADNNRLDTVPTITSSTKLSFDLTRGDKSSMSEQPDPILAYVKTKPTGGTSEANRVKLFFSHQFAQIQVNLKSSTDNSAVIDTAWIESVELLGVAETGYVPFCIQADGSVSAASFQAINVDDAKYAATIEDNPYGSCFSMFGRTTPVTGYLKSFECIAFGTLQGIRITWRESDDTDAVKHVTTYKGVKNLSLQSGTKYIYNMELRRSLIADVTAIIQPWDLDDTDYSADGTINTEDND